MSGRKETVLDLAKFVDKVVQVKLTGGFHLVMITFAVLSSLAAASDDRDSTLKSHLCNNTVQLNNANGKRMKTSEDENGGVKVEEQTSSKAAGNKVAEQSNKPISPPKLDYIHVRARRGQATDSHNLAERARREKISERMNTLQDLVPGCNKVCVT